MGGRVTSPRILNALTLDEHIQIDSLAYRGKLVAGLLMALA
jgi:hypothetical protein